MTMASLAPGGRAAVGAVIGLVVYGVSITTALLRLALIPGLSVRVTRESLLATALYLPLFVLAGGVVGRLSSLQVRVVRFILIGSLCGSLVWNYLTVTWPVTARPTSLAPSGLSALDAALIGAGLGAVGGLLLFGIRALRSKEG
ncbi:MAG: hypothetical protein Q8N53_11435 [Longimicrobiales bacterium]|nr:hypothetical protein [Longimicrobiales bacterium]